MVLQLRFRHCQRYSHDHDTDLPAGEDADAVTAEADSGIVIRARWLVSLLFGIVSTNQIQEISANTSSAAH